MILALMLAMYAMAAAAVWQLASASANLLRQRGAAIEQAIELIKNP